MSLNTPSSEPQQDSHSPLRQRMSTILGASALFLAIGCQDATKADSTKEATSAKTPVVKVGITRRGKPKLRVRMPRERKAKQANEANTSSESRAQVEGCLVKGNISGKGKKLYHIEDGCPDYDAVKINKKGERCFDTEAEALEAGWKKAGNCK